MLVLALLLLGAACNQRPADPPPPPPVLDPPAAGPLTFRLDAEEMILYFRYADRNIGAQLYVGPKDGSWRDFFVAFTPETASGELGAPLAELRLREGRIEVWGQDISWNKVYGGRRFRWVYHFRFDDSGPRPQLIFPDGPVAFEVLSGFPWGDREPTDPSVRQYLRNVSVGGGFQICIRDTWNSVEAPMRPGMYSRHWKMAGSASVTPGKYNFLVTYSWFDGEFTGRPAGGGWGDPALGTVRPSMDFNNPWIYDPSPRTHSAVLISKSLNNGQYPQPWEGRWFRAFNRGFGAWPDATQPGGVRCEYGEGWQVEEVTDPAEVALMEQYQSTQGNPNYYSLPPYPLLTRLDPRLCPTPWRQGDGSCDTGEP